MFKGWSYSQFKYGSGGNELKHLNERNGEHIEVLKEKERKEERNFIIEPSGSGINM